MTDTPLRSDNWYRVEKLCPRLKPDVTVVRHYYRGELWYVFQRAGGQVFRAEADSYALIGMMDGTNTVNDIWTASIEGQQAHAATQSQFERLLGQLGEADLISLDQYGDTEQLFARREAAERKDRAQRYLNPLYMRFSLWDPDRFLSALLPWVSWLLGRPALFAWAALVGLALIQLAGEWSTLRYELAAFDFTAPGNLLLVVFICPLLKFLHELGHCFTVKRFGGEVHEFGIALMVLMPIPYVDASASAMFADKRLRMLVGAAGIIVELGAAALGALLWSTTAPGGLHDAALLLMLVGGLSTLLFNGNPLLKFDGYYVLADALEIPNLAQRARAFLLGWLRRALFGMTGSQHAANDRREALWLIVYGVASSGYRIALMAYIAYLLSGEYFFFGTLLMGWVLFQLLLLPLFRGVRFVLRETGPQRPRAVLATGTLTLLLLGGLVLLPVPERTLAHGIVWLPEDGILRAAENCEIERLHVTPNTRVVADQPLYDCANPALSTELALAEAELDEVNAEYAGLERTDRVERQVLRNRRDTARARVARLKQRTAALTVRAARSGRFMPVSEIRLEGRHVRQGDIIAYVVPAVERRVRVAVAEEDIAALERGIDGVEVRFVERQLADSGHPSRINYQTPKAEHRVSNPALTTRGGGAFEADPTDERGLTTLDPVFELELAYPASAPTALLGSHVRVKFTHGAAPLFERMLTGLQRAFLGRFAS